MITYKISKETWSTYKKFNTPQECETWVLNLLGEGYDISISNMIITEPTVGEKLQSDISFGLNLIEEFLIDNRSIIPSLNSTESLQLLSQFSNIEKLARFGDLISVLSLLQIIEVDKRLFTQERKDKYINQLNSYLNLM